MTTNNNKLKTNKTLIPRLYNTSSRVCQIEEHPKLLRNLDCIAKYKIYVMKSQKVLTTKETLCHITEKM